MNILELGAIGELVGGVAVIASLIYVGLQVRQSTEQARQTNAIERVRANREMERAFNEIFMGAGDSELMKIYREALLDFDSLSNNDKAVLHHRFLAPMGVHVTSTFLAAKEGLVDEAWAEGRTGFWVSIVKSPGLTTWWNVTKPYFQPEFAAEIERLRESDEAPPAIHDILPWLAPDHSIADEE